MFTGKLITIGGLCAFMPLRAQTPQVTSAGFNPGNQFVVEANVPAGTRQAVLEVMRRPPATGWRSMLAGAVDGRAARVTFRLPRPAETALIARVRTDTSTVLPPAELTDPALYSVSYGEPVVSMDDKVAMLNGADEQFATLSGLSRDASQNAMVAWARSFPFVKSAQRGVYSDVICIEYLDGTTATLTNGKRYGVDVPANRVPRPQPDAAVAGPAARAVRSVGAAAVKRGLPESRQALCVRSLEAHFPNSAPTIAGWLGSHRYTTTTLSGAQAGVLDMAAASAPLGPLGVLFWQAHAFVWEGTGKTIGNIATAEVARKVDDKWDHGQLMQGGEVALAKDEATNAPPVYTVTHRFVKSRMHFAPHSLVLLDACDGAHPVIAGAFIEAGAGAVGSWDTLSGISSATPMEKVVDRLLGTNQAAPVSYPPERPFALPVIQQWMWQLGYDFDPSPKYKGSSARNATLTWRMHDTTPAHILRPAAMRVLLEFGTPDAPAARYLVEGSFGTDPGAARRKVFWGSQEVHVDTWDADDGIVIRPPASPRAGNIEVVIDSQCRSNGVPMTQWSIPFTHSASGDGSLSYQMTMNVKLHADIHGSRGMPEQPVEYLPVHVTTLGDSTGSVTASGTVVYNNDSPDFITWSGGSLLRSVNPATPAERDDFVRRISLTGTLHTTAGYLDVQSLMASGTYTSTDQNGSETATASVFGSSLVFNKHPSFNPGSSVIGSGSWGVPNSNGGTTTYISWGAAAPTGAPAVDTPR